MMLSNYSIILNSMNITNPKAIIPVRLVKAIDIQKTSGFFSRLLKPTLVFAFPDLNSFTTSLNEKKTTGINNIINK
jgi:hypothetical protein